MSPCLTRRPRPAESLLQILGLLAANHILTRWIGGGIEASAATFPGALALGFALGQAVIEEIVFRGVLFGWLQPRWGTGAAVVGPALLFGAVHGGPLQAGVATLLGVQLGAIRAAFGLPLAIAAHVANNAAVAGLSTTSVGYGDGLSVVATLVAGSAIAALVQSMRSSA